MTTNKAALNASLNKSKDEDSVNLSDIQQKINSDRIDFDLTTDHIESLSEKNAEWIKEINSFYFHIFDFAKAVGRNM